MAASNDASRNYAILYDADGKDRELALDEIAGVTPSEDQLLWVDLLAPDDKTLDTAWKALQLPDRSRTAIEEDASRPALGKNGDVFWARVAAIDGAAGDERESGDNKKSGQSEEELATVVLAIIAGKRFVLTIHDAPVEHLERQRNEEDVDSHVGALSAESFTAALLDWHLSTYFSAVADFENGIERVEVAILSGHRGDYLPRLRRLRKRASRLRRLLAPHRAVYGGMSRPDFRPTEGEQDDLHFQTIDVHFERAMDMVENARDLVIGSFELFSSQTALKTNKALSVLTFATVILGLLAVIGAILGMNFNAAFFDTELTGFLIATGAMVALGVLALVIGRVKHWFQ